MMLRQALQQLRGHSADGDDGGGALPAPLQRLRPGPPPPPRHLPVSAPAVDDHGNRAPPFFPRIHQEIQQ